MESRKDQPQYSVRLSISKAAGALALGCALAYTAATAFAHDSRLMLEDAELRWATQLAVLDQAGLDRPQLVASRAIVQRSWLWKQPTITVCFGPSSDVDRDLSFVRRIRDVASEWLAQARTKFDFGDERLRRCDEPGTPRSDMRVYVARSPSQGYYGVLGTNGRDSGVTGFGDGSYSVILSFPPNGSGFGELLADPPIPGRLNWRFFVLHEFGHALGFLHEHQRIDCGFDEEWLKTQHNPPYSDAFIRSQIRPVPDPIAPYPADVVYQTKLALGTRYDPTSVMQYFEPNPAAFKARELSPCYKATPTNELSIMDKTAAAFAYDGTGRGLDDAIPDPDSRNMIFLSERAKRAVERALSLP